MIALIASPVMLPLTKGSTAPGQYASRVCPFTLNIPAEMPPGTCIGPTRLPNAMSAVKRWVSTGVTVVLAAKADGKSEVRPSRLEVTMAACMLIALEA